MYNKAMEKQVVKEKLKSFKDYYIVGGIVFVLFALAMLLNADWPFGKNTILLSDSFVQIGALFEHIFDWISGDVSLFYAPNLGSGVEIFSTIEYMFFNPFFLVVLIGGKANILFSFNIAVMFMFLFNAFVFLWFSRKHFKNISEVFRVLFAVMFAFSSYINFNFAFVTWLIYPAITLLLVDAFLSLVKDGKILKFTIYLIWFVVNCYSVGVSANIVLILLFSAYIFLIVEKEQRKEVFTRLLVSYVVAVLVSVALLLPALLSLLGTSRMSEALKTMLVPEPFKHFLSKISALALDGAVLFFAIKYLILCDKKEKQNKFMLFSFTVLVIPILFDVALKLLCGGVYSGFASRFYFLNEVFNFILLQKLFNQKEESKPSESTEKSNTIFKFLYVMLLSIIILCVIFLEIFHYKKIGVNVKNPVAVESNVYLVLILNAFLILILMLFVSFAKFRKLVSDKLVKFNTIFVLVFTLSFNFLAFSGFARTDFSEKTEAEKLTSINLVTDNAKAFKADFCEGCSYNLSGFGITTSYFSSLISKEAVDSYKALGFKSSMVISSAEGGTIIADSLMGLKYYISKESLNRPYLKFIDKSENYYLYENILSTSGAVVLDESFVFDNNKNMLENIDALKTSLGVSSTLFEDANVIVEDFKNYDDMYARAVKKCTFTASEDCVLYFNSSTEKFSGSESYFDDILKDKNIFYIEKYYDGAYSDIEYLSAGESIEFYVCVTDDEVDLNSFKFTCMNYGIAKNICEELQKRQVDLKPTKNGFEVHGTTAYSGKLFVSKLNIDGMNYTLNGEKIDAKSEFGGFASLSVLAGEINVVASYAYTHKLTWLIVFVVAVILVTIILVLYKKTKFKHIQKVVCYAFYGLSCGILSIFYLFGLVLSIFALIL